MVLYTYEAIVTKIIDGDTFDVDVDLGFHTHQHLRIRLLGIDTPETKITKGIDEKEFGLQARQFAVDTFLNKKVFIQTEKEDSFGRWLAYLFIYNENHELLDALTIYNKVGINKLNPTTYKWG